MYTPGTGPIRIKAYGMEETLVDCFRHRRRLGMELLLEALKDAIKQRRLMSMNCGSRLGPSGCSG